jgi:hypothetical protein
MPEAPAHLRERQAAPGLNLAPRERLPGGAQGLGHDHLVRAEQDLVGSRVARVASSRRPEGRSYRLGRSSVSRIRCRERSTRPSRCRRSSSAKVASVARHNEAMKASVSSWRPQAQSAG